MSHIEDVARLKKLEAKEIPATYSTTYPEYEYACGVLNAAPRLLAVAGQFQEGDAERLELLILNEQQRWTDERWQAAIDCLHRMLAAARIMEGEK